MKKLITYLTVFLFVYSCSMSKQEKFVVDNNDIIRTDILTTLPSSKISYKSQVRPILDKRCVVCHGCYDAPCQLKLSSIEGIKRGAHIDKVYDGSRITATKPNRLYIDHQTNGEWRKKEFHAVVPDTLLTEEENLENSLLYKFLQLKEIYPQPRSGLISPEIDTSLNRNQYCPTIEEFSDFSKEHQNLGMPFATPNLTHKEFLTIGQWIAQGAHGTDSKVETESTKKLIFNFEKKLNSPSLKYKLISRYIYEHIFLGHIHFKGDSNKTFYRLIRARNKKGKGRELKTIRPYDDPKGVFYYRFILYKPTIVAKSHNIYELSKQKLKRFDELFYNKNFSVSSLPSYTPDVASNPFKVYKDIPVHSKYSFLLDNSRFFIEGFIKGPVCRGQIALNVIEDRFWVFFANPDARINTNDDHFINKNKEVLQLPADKESDMEFLSIWTHYWKKQKDFLKARNKLLKKSKVKNIDEVMNFLWDGNGRNPNAALTIFRHLDSASVRQGLIGEIPKTTWIIDYPILERIHYLLVAGFNVYGNVGHQLKTRLYMDFLRMEGENLFLTLLPVKERKELHKSWYGGNRKHINFFSSEPSQWLDQEYVKGFNKKDKFKEIHTYLKSRVINAIENKQQRISKELKQIDKFKGRFLRYFPETILLKVNNTAYTLVHNKEYKYVSFFLNDATNRSELDEENDSLTVVKGIEGSYPNLFMEVDKEQLPEFIEEMANILSEADYHKFISKYGIRRTHSNYWFYSDWFHGHHKEIAPLRSGILDLNRYQL